MPRRLALLFALLVVLPATPSPAGDGTVDVVEAAREALAQVGIDLGKAEVREVAFWEAAAPRLREAGVLREGVRLPRPRDPLRPSPVWRPERALEIARDLTSTSRDPFDRTLLDPAARDVERSRALGEDPIPPEVVVPPVVRRLARRLAALEDLAARQLPAARLPEPAETWVREGIGPDEVAAARAALEAHADVDLLPLLDLALATLGDALQDGPGAAQNALAWPQDGVLRVETPRGLVLVGTAGDDAYADDAWLVVDPGGSDRWGNNAGGTAGRYRAALAVDLAGDDHYGSEAPYVQGSARDGVGLLLDLGGDDAYAGKAFCQAAAVGGLALLYDGGGSDTFDASEYAQAAATAGVALLRSDGDGDDRYALDRLGQALGRTKGFGVLSGGRGNDRYLVRDTHESMYSQWTGGRKVFWSFAQGCGFGFYCRYDERRADGSEGLVIREMLPGGLGLLRDEAGDDAYRGSMYAQGTAYFQGVGICADLAGNDTYEASWYGQGAAPHFATGILVDGGGDDRYVGMHQVQGNGRDFSIGLLLDLGGDDVYEAEDRVQGCGDLRDGWGLLVDAAGDDRYVATRKTARGYATLVKPDEQPTEEKPWADVGVFLDLGGTDTYEGKAAGADGTTWIQAETRRGIGVDR